MDFPCISFFHLFPFLYEPEVFTGSYIRQQKSSYYSFRALYFFLIEES